jgi:hypothetical protein
MSLFKYCNLQANQVQLLYIESSNVIQFGIFSYKKIKVHSFMYFYLNNSAFLIYKSIFCSIRLFLKYWRSFFFILQAFFFGNLIGYLHGFRLLGRGYKTYLNLNNYVFRLGYSHNIYYTMPFYYKTQLKEKIKNFWIVKGTSNTALSNIMARIRSFRIPNTYRYKGVYRMNESYKLKINKKGNAL